MQWRKDKTKPGAVTWFDVLMFVLFVGTVLAAFTYSELTEAQESYDALQLKASETGEEITVRWCNSDGQSSPEWTHTIQVIEFPPKPNQFPTYQHVATGAATQWQLTPTRAGLYYIQARSCSAADGCSGWGISITQDGIEDACATNPQNLLWYFKLAAPTGGGIE